MRSVFLLLFISSSITLSAQNAFEALSTEVGIESSVEGVPTTTATREFGAGLSVVDFTGDGLEDITIATGAGFPVRFFQNNGDGTFSELPDLLGNNLRFQKAVLYGDIDNDGDQDLFVTAWEDRSRLYRNDGNLNFKDITVSANLKTGKSNANGASFCDVNNDGLLDLYVCNRNKTKLSNYLYINQGNNVFFEEANLRGVSNASQLSFQSVFFDYDNDGDQDLYIANDRAYRNALYNNDGQGLFTDVSQPSGTDIRIDAMNTGVGDMNLDGYLDIFVTNTIGNNGYDHLLLNNGDGTFSEISETAGADLNLFTWAGLWLDYDNDTDEDLFVCSLSDSDPFILLQNFKAESGLDVFLNPYPSGLPESYQISFSAGYLDYNNDGLLDIVTPNLDPSPIQVWQNTSSNENNYIKFKLEGVYSTRDAVGSLVEVFIGEQRYTRYLRMSDSYLSQNHNQLHFGLGTAAQVDSVVVKWLSGVKERYYNLEINTTYELVENQTSNLDISLDMINPACTGDNTGLITASIDTGVAPFLYTWNTGATSTILEEIPAGRYILTVTDSNGDLGIAIAELIDPTLLSSTVTSINDSGSNDGIAVVMPSGGSGNYSYQWSIGAETATVNGLSVGMYTVTVADENSCTTESLAVIYDESAPCAACIPTVVETTSNSATLYWGAVPNAEKYRIIYREIGSEIWLSPNENTSSTFLEIENLSAYTTFEYRTRTSCFGGQLSDWSEILLFTTQNTSAENCVAWIPSEIFTAGNLAVLIFDDIPDATSYRIRFRAVGESLWQKMASLYSLISIELLTPGTQYEFQTASRCGDQWTAWSDIEYFETGGGINLRQANFEEKQDDLREDADLIIFPNPTSHLLNINAPNNNLIKLEVYSSSGQCCLRPRLLPQIDISELESGIYYLVGYFENGEKVVCRFVKL